MGSGSYGSVIAGSVVGLGIIGVVVGLIIYFVRERMIKKREPGY
ncbi:MAG: hypothetical protein ABH864_00015 [archaeon]